MDLFSLQRENRRKKTAPLADRMRPVNFDEFLGQTHIVGPGKPLRRLIEADRVPSMILYGPPGSGKTSLAELIAKSTDRIFTRLSAVTSGVKDIREVIDHAKEAISFEAKDTILFIDEIHRFNKSQQDALLPHVENGTISLIGATTENPFFQVNPALLSRCQLFELHYLEREELMKALDRALTDKERGLGEYNIHLTDKAVSILIASAGGDVRILLNSLEVAALSTAPKDGIIEIDEEIIRSSIQRKSLAYDRDEDHYNTISAFIKSVRGSDPNAAIYYLARMLAGGEDPLFIARRLIILASEDIGNAEPMGLILANACYQAVERIGMPEGRIILAHTTAFLAGSSKSNASYLAIDEALSLVRKSGPLDIPAYLMDAHYKGAEKLGRGEGYLYPHDYPKGYVLQNYLPNEIIGTSFYRPKNIGYEKIIGEYLSNLRKDSGEFDKKRDMDFQSRKRAAGTNIENNKDLGGENGN